MDAANSSSCSALAEHTTTALFHERLRALLHRRLVLARAALVSQLEVLQFDLRELESTETLRALTPNSESQLPECISEPSAERKAANAGTSISVTDDKLNDLNDLNEHYQILCCRVRASATKVLSLASELRSTLCASEQDIDADSADDIQKTLAKVCKILQSCGVTGDNPNSFRRPSVAILDPSPVEPLLAIRPTALFVKLNELGLEEFHPNSPAQEEEIEDVENAKHRQAGNIAESFFAEEFRLLRFPSSGAVSFQGNFVLQSLCLSQLYQTQQIEHIIPQSCRRRNFCEYDLGFPPGVESVSNIASIFHESALSRDGDDSHNFSMAVGAGHVRFHFFQRRTYYDNQEHCTNELRAASAPWCPDLDGPPAIFELPAPMPEKLSRKPRSGHRDHGILKRECRIVAGAACPDQAPRSGCAYDNFRGDFSGITNASGYSDLPPLSAYEYNGYCADATPLVRATSAGGPSSGYGYNGFRVDAAITAPAIVNPNFQKRTVFPLQTPNLGHYSSDNPDLVGMSPPAADRNDQLAVTNPLDFLLNRSSFTRGPYFTFATSSSPVVLSSDDEVGDTIEVYCINKDGSLSKPC